MAIKILNEEFAIQAYDYILKTINENNRHPSDKLVSFSFKLEKIYQEMVKNDKVSSKKLFYLIGYIEGRYPVSKHIIDQSDGIRVHCNDSKHEDIRPKVSYYKLYIKALIDIIYYYSSKKIPKRLENAFEKISSTYKIKLLKKHPAMKNIEVVVDKKEREIKELEGEKFIYENKIKKAPIEKRYNKNNKNKITQIKETKVKQIENTISNEAKIKKPAAAQTKKTIQSGLCTEKQERDRYSLNGNDIREHKRNKIKRKLLIQTIIGIVIIIIFLKTTLWANAILIWVNIFAFLFTINRIYNLINFERYYKRLKKKKY